LEIKMNHVDVMKQALEALEYAHATCPYERARQERATTDLRKAIAQAEKADPVASIYITPSGEREFDDWKCKLPTGRNVLYTAPQAAQPAEPVALNSRDCPYCNHTGSFHCGDAKEEILRDGGTLGYCSNAQVYGRRAQPASTVPAFNGPASRKLADLQAQGWQVSGVHIQRQDGDTWKHGAITAGGMVLWWHGKQGAASPEKCPTCGSDCNEIDELAKAELEQQLAEFVRVGTLYSESWPIVESGWRFALGDLQCTGFAVERAVFIVAKGST